MNGPTASPEILDSDIVRLFEKQRQYTSPDDLDKRILEAAAFAVRGDGRESFQAPIKKTRRPSMLMIVAAVLLVLALLYPVLRSFLDLPSKVQNSSRIFSQEPAGSSLNVK